MESNFNWALLIGCGLVALAIFVVGSRIANSLPHTMHGNFHGTFSTHGTGSYEPQEFMSEWEAADFLRMGLDEFESLLRAGELAGTYAIFEVERREWRWENPPRVIYGDITAPVPAPTLEPTEYDIITVDHRIFSRERLTEWLNNRI